MSLPQELHDVTLKRLVDTLGLQEETDAEGGPWMPMISQVPIAEGSVGAVRLFRGGKITQLVSCSIVVPAIQLDSHMLFAFTDTEGAVPHFTVDSVRNGENYAFHLDLIPRLDLAVELAHMDEVFAPLTESFKAHSATPGLTAAHLDPRQYAVMSPWMLASRADEAAFKATFATVETYLDHWFEVLERGVEAVGKTTAEQRAARDAAHRGILFNPQVDQVWNQITPLIGAGAVEKLLTVLKQTRV